MATLQRKESNKKSSNQSTKHALIIGIPVILIPLLYSTRAVDVVLLPKFIAFSLFAILILALSIDFSIKNPAVFNGIKQHWFFKIYLVYLIAAFVSMQLSCNDADALFEWLKLLLFGSCIFATAIYFYLYRKTIEHLAIAVNLLNLIIVIIGIIQFLMMVSKQQVTHTATYEVTATFGHKNIFAELLFLTFPFATYNSFTRKDFWKWLGTISAFLTLFLITLSLTRAVWIATIGAFVLTAPFYFFSLSKDSSFKQVLIKNRKNVILLGVICLAIAASIAVYSRIDSFNTIKMQTITISSFKYGSVGERIQLWKKSIEVFKESPLFGKGLGSWKIEVLKYGHKGLETENNVTFHQRPHNDFIWILAEQGIVGLLAYLTMAILLLVALVRLVFKTENKQEKLFFFLMLYAYAGYLIYSCLSFPKERIEHQIILLFIMAIIISKTTNVKSTDTSKRYILPLFIFLLLLSGFALNIGVSRFKSEVHLQKAYTARNNGLWQQTINEIEQAENEHYTIDPMCTPLKWYSGSAFYNLGNQEMAFNHFNEAFQVNPNHVHVLNNLATAYELKGDHLKAIDLYKKALLISPGFEEAKSNLCATYFNAGKKQEALLQFQALKMDTTNVKYRQMLKIILCQEISRLADSITCDPLKNMLKAVYNTPQWYTQIFVKANQNNISFQHQLIKDAIFTLDSVDKNTNFAYISSMLKKYTTQKN